MNCAILKSVVNTKLKLISAFGLCSCHENVPLDDGPVLNKSLQCLTLCRTNGLQLTTRLLCPWDSSGKNTGVGCQALLQRIFPSQR